MLEGVILFFVSRFSVLLMASLVIGSLSLGTLLVGCQVYNSSSQDEQKYSASGNVKTASGILQSHCGTCHNYGQKSFSQLVSQGLIVSGSPMSSLLYTRIRGSGSNQDENMPQVGSSASDLTAEELALIKNWISTGGSTFQSAMEFVEEL